MNKKLATFVVAGVIAISGFSGVIAGSKVFAVESSDTQSLKDEIEETKQKLQNQIDFLNHLAKRADKYIRDVASGKLEKPISPSIQAKNYLNKLDPKDAYVLEYREAVLKEIEHIDELAKKKYQGVYKQLPELKEMQGRIRESILALTDEGNYIAHIENRQKELLGEKDLNKAERNAKMLKVIINRYFNKLRAQYGNEFLLADRFESSLIAGIDNVTDQINKKIEEEKIKQAAEEDLKKAAQEEADRLKKDEENNSDAWEKIANEENKKNENKKQDEKLDKKQGQNSSEVKASELPENQISKKDNKQIQTLQAPNTGENQKHGFETVLIGVISIILAAISAVVIKRQ